MSVIEAQNVSIRYITGDLKNIGLKEYIMRNLQGNYHVQEFWADKDITFSLEKGDMLGIIGTNGAGKSTLLKAISGIMQPTKGKMIVDGNVAALLELASGFDGDLNIRENTYLRGAMLGYTRDFMDEQYDNIIEFAELQDFQSSLFKQLSSGMKSRLAFSIACLVNPDVIILDEVLSVGDGAFRAKSAARMKEILSSGVTGILVSHSVSQVREMCNKILWLDHGNQIGFSDDVKLYCDAYEEFLKNKQLPNSEEEILALAQIRWDREAEAERLRLEREAKKEQARLLQEARKEQARLLQEEKREREKQRLLENRRAAMEKAQLARDKQEDLRRKLEDKDNRARELSAQRDALREKIEDYKELRAQNKRLLKELSDLKKATIPKDAKVLKAIFDNYKKPNELASIEIKNVGSPENRFIFLKKDFSDAELSFPKWATSRLGQGCHILTEQQCLSFKLQCMNAGFLRFYLLGPKAQYDDKNEYPVFVVFDKLVINGQDVLEGSKIVSHENYHIFKKDVEDGEIIDVMIQWHPFNMC